MRSNLGHNSVVGSIFSARGFAALQSDAVFDLLRAYLGPPKWESPLYLASASAEWPGGGKPSKCCF